MTKTSGIIVGAKSFRNEYDGDTLSDVLTQVASARGCDPEIAICDRGFRGRKKVLDTTIVLPDAQLSEVTEHFKRKARSNFRRRCAIEPVIGHLKSDFRLARNYLKGTIGDVINLILAAAAFNCKKWMRAAAQMLLFSFCFLFSIRANKVRAQFQIA